jgi:hypothetical protein
MAFLLFTCPNTRRRAPTSIEMNVASLHATWSQLLKVHCSLCGEVHEISVSETFVDSALHDATDRARGLV